MTGVGSGECGALRRARGDRPCAGPLKYRVEYRSSDGRVLERSSPCCFTHGLAEVERHLAAGGAAEAHLVEV